MPLKRYWLEVDSKFFKSPSNPPERLSPAFFNPDGSAKPLLHDISEKIDSSWGKATEQEMLGKYVIQTHATGKFWEGSDFDVGLATNIDYIAARELEKRVNNIMIGKGTPAYEEAKRQYEAGKRNFVQCHILIAKPYETVFDLTEMAWITFGKTMQHHEQFVRHVLGLDPDLSY